MHIQVTSNTPIDLQMHTTYSDGRWSAERLFDYLAEVGFGLVAVTDHDRVDTVASIQQLGAQKQVPVLSAVEISAEFHGKMADVLCFGFDPHEEGISKSFCITCSNCNTCFLLVKKVGKNLRDSKEPTRATLNRCTARLISLDVSVVGEIKPFNLVVANLVS